ncbi:N-acetylmuramoyl-L-alanine amidase [Tepidibacter formicigenes]|jgi:SpoIID/LytB domain protein|uniref:SpoIID/LytB domain protein n=1 Tax=Tepidibacter formicigenes DSM 15518 TaxID=1123349 RepID=A0A1M6QY24_9FIRM|nr:N-acetylmuramoyl-L-alanine amidase [Tepidibacter formicigenes]SHK25105.1 SpoIID/LytB domain protein [Tepidibacter formicigenes DSM 15518]
MDKKYRNLIAYRVSKNTPKDFHLEALKCQAIIERTTIFRSIKDGSLKIEDINNDYIDSRIYKAVDDTKNLVIMFNNRPILAFYHISCGGNTENSENILNRKIDYLRGVTCKDCKDNKDLDNVVDIDLEELLSMFNGKMSSDFLDDFFIKDILKVIKRTESKRIESILVFNKEVKGTEFSNNLNLDSSRFGFRPIKIRFYTKGIGHGLGFCQRGANEKAKKNWKFEDILNYYYTNINICKLEEFNSNLPLKNIKIFIDPGHGGKDLGYLSNEGVSEKEITLKFSLVLKEKLEEYGASVCLSRSEDKSITLDERADMIKKYKPDFLISIHLNKSKFKEISGIEGFYYWGDVEGEILGKEIINVLSKKLNIKNRGIREGKIYILEKSICSGIYFELGYLSNIQEVNNFNDKKFLKNMAVCMVEGFLKYYQNKMLT